MPQNKTPFEHATKVYSSDILMAVQTTTGKTLKEKDAVIDLVCDICRLHQQSGFIAALKLAHRLSQELNN